MTRGEYCDHCTGSGSAVLSGTTSRWRWRWSLLTSRGQQRRCRLCKLIVDMPVPVWRYAEVSVWRYVEVCGIDRSSECAVGGVATGAPWSGPLPMLGRGKVLVTSVPTTPGTGYIHWNLGPRTRSFLDHGGGMKKHEWVYCNLHELYLTFDKGGGVSKQSKSKGWPQAAGWRVTSWCGPWVTDRSPRDPAADPQL